MKVIKFLLAIVTILLAVVPMIVGFIGGIMLAGIISGAAYSRRLGEFVGEGWD